MNSNYLQAILEGRPADAQHLVTQLRPRIMPTTLAEALKSNFPFLTMLPRLPTEKARAFDPLEPFAPFVAARKPHGLVTDVARIQQLEILRSILPAKTFAGLVKTMSAPTASLQQRAEEITQLLADVLVEEDAPSQVPSSEEGIQAGGGFSIGDEAIAHVIRPADPTSNANCWAALSHDAKMTILFSLVMALILLVPQIPSYINSYREMRDGSNAITNEQGRQLIAATQATKEMLAEVLALQKQSAASDASFQREAIALQRGTRPWLDSLMGQPCEVLVETSVRELGRADRSMKEIDRLHPGDVVLCIGRHGKWLQVAYDGMDGGRIYGIVRKKHLAWQDVR